MSSSPASETIGTVQKTVRPIFGLGLFVCSFLCVIAALVSGLSGRWQPAPGSTNHDKILAEWGIPRSLPISYLENVSHHDTYTRFVSSSNRQQPDTTAVVLNWSRFSNVVLIVSLLCKPELNDVISHVFIWNNNPKPITLKDFALSRCSPEKLRVYNSPSNLLFQARFIACAQSNTTYCFTQDDDYLIRPEIITALHGRMMDIQYPRAIHLLPPHEHLSSQLRELRSADGKLHTSFAWLGHGTIFPRSDADEFLELMHSLNLSLEEIAMADNYFAILKNDVPETWFDQSIELGGGQPFTAGAEGDLRNRRHITKAAQYLDCVLDCDIPPWISSSQGEKEVPYIRVGETARISLTSSVYRAACAGATCMMETNIQLLPTSCLHISNSAQTMLSLEEQNVRLLGEDGKEHYLHYPPSLAVDGLPHTAFVSPGNARTGEFVHLDLLETIVPDVKLFDMAFLADVGTERILHACTFESSADGVHWVRSDAALRCSDSTVDHPDHRNETGSTLKECYVPMQPTVDMVARHFKTSLQGSVDEKWRIHEVWLRGLLV